MKKLVEIGTCPKCQCSIYIYKTNQHKRFAKCEGCETSYPLPKRGSLSISALICPLRSFPILIVDKQGNTSYFWADQPCFSCINYDNCKPVNELIEEFIELEVHRY
ncbi:MAG: hypothetical protein ACFFBP_13630 [Promethearchaeota archaeon]